MTSSITQDSALLAGLAKHGQHTTCWLFLYSDWEIINLLDVPIETIQANLFSASLMRWHLGFFSYADKWGGSTATIDNSEEMFAIWVSKQTSSSAEFQTNGLALKIGIDSNGRFLIGDRAANIHELLTGSHVGINKYRLRLVEPLMVNIADNVQRVANAFALVGNLQYIPMDQSIQYQGYTPSEPYKLVIKDILLENQRLSGKQHFDPIMMEIIVWRNNQWVYQQLIIYSPHSSVL